MQRSTLFSLAAAVSLSFGAASVFADTVILKSGERVEGKIQSETDVDVTMQVNVSASITDERTIDKAEIQEIKKSSEDGEAYDVIKNFKTNEDHSYPLESYDQMLTSLGAFLQQYPLSEHLADVKQQQAALETERKRVENGDLKFNGQWLSPEQAGKEKYQIEAAGLLQTIKSNAGEGNFSGALNAFDTLNTKYSGARVYPDAVDYMKGLIPNLQSDAQRRLNALVAEQKQFMANVQFRQEPRKSQLIAAARREQDTYAETFNAANTRWKPYMVRSNLSLQTYLQQLPGLATQVASVQTEPMRQANDSIAQAKAAIASKDAATAKAQLDMATQLWPKNEELKSVSDDLATLTAALAAEAQKAPVPTATPIATPKASAASVAAQETRESAAAPFFLSIKGALVILGIIVVIAGVFAILGKARASKNDEQP